MIRNITIEDLFSATITIPTGLPWDTNVTTGPILGRNEVRLLTQFNNKSGMQQYIELRNRFSQLKNQKRSGHTVLINGEDLSKEEFYSLIDVYEKQFDDLMHNIVNVVPIHNSIISRQIQEAKPARRAGASVSPINLHGGPQLIPETLSRIGKLKEDAESRAAESLLGPDGNALQIGWMSFGPDDAGPNVVRLGPDKVSFADFNNVRTTNTIRSDTDIALKGPGGRALIDIDIIFPTVQSINGSNKTIDGSNVGRAGLRELLGMLRMSPVITVGGRAIGAALLNQVTASEVYEELRSLYFENHEKNHQDIFDVARNKLGEKFEITFDALTNIMKSERDTYDLLQRHFAAERKKKDVKKFDIDYVQGTPPNKKDFVDSLNVHSVLIPLVCQSITLSTISSAPGAVRVRLSFQKYHNPYETAGGLAFYDKDGDATFDARRAQPLRDGVNAVYLSPQRAFPTVDGTMEYRDNVYYIPRIGDTTDGAIANRTIAGFDKKEDSARYKVNDLGFMTYAPRVSKKISLTDDDFSPIMFRFSPVGNPIQSYEYIPNNMVLRNVSWHYANKIASFPMEGEIYPGFQYMGRASVTANLNFSTTDEKAVQQFFTMKGMMDGHATFHSGPELARREYLDIYNDILLLSGISRWVIAGARVETDPDSPGLYHLQVEIISNEESIHKRERLRLISNNAPDSKLRALWWWMYAGLYIKFQQAINAHHHNENRVTYDRSLPADTLGPLKRDLTSELDKLLNGEFGNDSPINPQASAFNNFGGGNAFGRIGLASSLGKEASHTQEEVNTIWRIVFGGFYDGKYQAGFLENNVFKSAFLEVFRKGHLKIPRVSTSTLFPDKFGSSDTTNVINNDLGIYLSYLFKLAERGAGNLTEDEEDRDVASGDGDWVDVSDWIRRIADYYDGQKGPLKPSSPWWIVNPIWGEKGMTVNWLRELQSAFNKQVNKDASPISMISHNLDGKVFWIPTPELWSQIYWVLSNWYKLKDKNKPEYGYEVQRAQESGDINLFYMSSSLQYGKRKLSEIVSNPRYRRFFPTFWKKFGSNIEDLATKLNPYGDSHTTDLDFQIDPEVFELRNNYIDLPMPRFFEIFSDNLSNGSRPLPRTDSGGYEVWRKVAPSYLELGIKPSIYASMSILTNSDEVSIKSPGLLTPRSFFDYCDPGYFYFRRSWLAEQYNEIVESMHKDVLDGHLAPLGDDDSTGFALSSKEQQRLALRESGVNPDYDNIRIARADFSLEAFVDAEPGVDKTGVRTKSIRGEVDWGNISRKFSKMALKELEYELSRHIPGSTHAGLDKLYKVVRAQLPRVFVLDSTGRKIGMIVSRGGSTSTTGATIHKLDNITELMYKQGYTLNNLDKQINTADLLYIDLTSKMARTPKDVVYQDHQGVIKHNLYKPEGAKKEYLSTLEHMGDLKQNHMRAYPTYKLYFVKERVEGDELITTLEEDMYGYNSIISLDITLDKDDADTAKILITDISGNLSTATFDSDTESLREIPGYSSNHTNGSQSILKSTSDNEDLFDTDKYEKVKLEVGTNILIKMGYGNDPETLKTVFTGAIAEIQNGPITTIVAQSYKAELYRQVNVYSEKGLSDAIFDELTNNDNVGPISANYLIFRVLQELAVLPTHSGHDSAGGIPHLGRFLSLTEYERLRSDIKDRYSNDFQRDRDRGLDAGNSIDSLLAWGTGGLFLAGTLISRNKLKGKVLGGLTGLFAANRLSNSNVFSSSISWLRKYSAEFMHTNAMRNIFFANDARSDNWMDYMSQEWLIDGDGWNALKEISRYKLGYICQVVPYGSNATLFIGKGDTPYHYKPISQIDKARYELARPFQQFASFSVLYSKIFSRFFSSPDYGLNTVRSQWVNFSGLMGHGSLSFRSPIPIGELSLEQYIREIESYVRSLASRSTGLTGESIDDLMRAELLNDALPFLHDIKVFPSYSIARYIISNLRSLLNRSGTISDSDRVRSYTPRQIFGDGARISYIDNQEPILADGSVDTNLILIGYQYTENQRPIDINNILKGWEKYTSEDNIIKDQITAAGYEIGDYWAYNFSGKLISKKDLQDKYNIDPSTGRPKYSFNRVQDAGDPRRGRTIHFATTEGFGAFTLGETAWGSPFLSKFRFSPRDGRKNAQEYTATSPDHMILLSDHSDDLNYIRGYGDNIEKILFAIFFGLTWVRGPDGQPQFLYFGDTLDSIYKSYGTEIMRAIGEDGVSDLMSDGDKVQALWDRLQNARYGILSPLNTLNDGGQIKYENYAVSGRTIDGQILEDGATLFKAEIQTMVLNGQIRPEEAQGVLDRFKQFMQLASNGLLASVFADNIFDPQGVSDAAKVFSLDDKKTAIEVGNRIKSYSSLIDKIMSQDVTIDPDLRDAFSVLIGLDPASQQFDPRNVGHLISLRTVLNDINLSHSNLSSIENMSPRQRQAMTKILDSIDVNGNQTLDDSEFGNLVATATQGSISQEIINDIENIDTPSVLAYGAKPGVSMYQLLLQNCDYYKAFLIFFAKWLRKDGSKEKSLRNMRVDHAISKVGKEESEPGVKRFVDVHYIVSGVDIIENEITATMSEMANNILLMTPEDIHVQAMTDPNAPKPIYKFDQFNTKMIPYPNYQFSGIDWNAYVRPELRKQRLVIERNAETDQQRMALLINHMAEAIRPMYRGHLTVTGRVIKPYDRIVLIDSNKDMYGIIEVEHITHSFNADSGWTTTIVPCAWINAMEPSSELMQKFDTSNISAMLKTLGTVDWLLDAWFWAGIILSPFTGGVSAAAGTATRQAAKAGVGSFARNMIGNAFKKSMSGLARIGLAGVKVAGPKGAAQGLKNTLLGIRRASLGSNMQAAYAALTSTVVDSFIGRRAAYYGAGILGNQVLKWGAGLYLNQATDNVLRGGTLPIHTYCLTRFGKPIHAGLDMDVSTFYSWDERFGHTIKSMTTKIGQFLDEAFTIHDEDLTNFTDVFTNLEGR